MYVSYGGKIGCLCWLLYSPFSVVVPPNTRLASGEVLGTVGLRKRSKSTFLYLIRRLLDLVLFVSDLYAAAHTATREPTSKEQHGEGYGSKLETSKVNLVRLQFSV